MWEGQETWNLYPIKPEIPGVDQKQAFSTSCKLRLQMIFMDLPVACLFVFRFSHNVFYRPTLSPDVVGYS